MSYTYMTLDQYVAMRALARRSEQAERVAFSLANQRRAFDAAEWGAEVSGVFDSAIRAFRLEASRLQRHAMKAAKGSPFYAWAKDAPGIGPAMFFFAGQLPPLGPLEVMAPDLSPFKSPSALWKYCGLSVDDGAAPKRQAGKLAGFNSKLRAFALYRIGVCSIRLTASPYRAIYDARKAATLLTHPPMLDTGAGCPFCDDAYGATKAHRAERKNLTRERATVAFDCANRGGPHWTDGHRHNDALRVMTKAILLDAWRVANGLPAKVSHPRRDNQTADAALAGAA